MRISKHVGLFALAVAMLTGRLNAAEYHGYVKYGGLPLPGATVTVTQGDKKMTALADATGMYSFADVADGAWNIEVEMLCFAPIKQDVTLAGGAPAGEWEMKLLTFEQIKTTAVEAPPPPPPTSTTDAAVQTPSAQNNSKGSDKKNAKNAPATPPANGPGGFQRTQANAAAGAPKAAASEAAPSSEAFGGQSASDLSSKASDGFLINGTSNNSATSPFALSAAFGNSRRGGRSLYNGNIGVIIDNSAFDARPFSQTGQDTERPPYTHLTGVLALGGPLKIPHLLKNGPNIFINYQWTRNRNAGIVDSLVPTLEERAGNFANVPGLNGLPVQLTDPRSGLPISSDISGRITPQARALLAFFPLPNFVGSDQFNYQVPIVSNQHADALQGRAQKGIGRKNQLSGGVGFQSVRNDNPNGAGFAFLDTSNSLGMNVNVNWRHSFTNRLSATAGYTFSRFSLTSAPFFANRQNVSGAAGINGNNQDPQNWGPPSLSFASGIAGLSDGNTSEIHNETNAVSYAFQWNRGRHNVSFGADYKRLQFNAISQQNPRGSFTFNGTAAGNDFAGFLLGVPDSSSIAFGNADKYFRSTSDDAFITDDWRISPGFTLNIGARWEYNSPITELYGRLVNLDITKGFAAVAPVIANNPTGSLTGQKYPDSLVRPDKNAIQPRIAISWRPLPASSLVVRAGYGTYYNTSVYQGIAQQMAQQAPLSKSLSLANSALNPLTLANGFPAPVGVVPTTFAIDPDFRVGYTHTWQVSVQRDLPAALIMTATYLGIKGTRGTQEFLPNTYPNGVTPPCGSSCATGFIYLASNGNSTREAGQIQLRRRLHNGLTASVQYVYAKAIDDAALGGRGGGGAVIAQNWLDLSAERGLSSFDQRHSVTINGQYTSGMGMKGGTLLSGWRGTAFKEWTIVADIIAGTGFPLTPIYSQTVQGTGITGPIRPDYTGADLYAAPEGKFLNPLAYTKPANGQWGNAGRDSITGPSQFVLNSSMARTFRVNDRISLDFRVDLKNAFNHVTFPGWYTNINSQQFGAAQPANAMRVAQTTIRFRF